MQQKVKAVNSLIGSPVPPYFLSTMQPSTVIVVICIEGVGFFFQSTTPAQGPADQGPHASWKYTPLYVSDYTDIAWEGRAATHRESIIDEFATR